MTTHTVNMRSAAKWHQLRARCVALLVACICVGAAVPSPAQSPTPAASATPAPAGPADEFERGVPRSVVQGYLGACDKGDYERASNYLDLRRIPKSQRVKQGATLARELSVVLDRKLWVNPELLSDAPEGDSEDGLPPRNDLVGAVQTTKGTVQILLERVPREDGTLVWKFSSATVAQIPDLYEEFGYGPLGELLPAPFFDVRFLQIQLWQWIALLLLVFVAAVVSWLVTNLLVRVGRSLVTRTRTTVDDQLFVAAVGPLRLTIGSLVFFGGSFALALSVRADAFVIGIGKILSIVAVTWLVFRCVDALSQAVEDRLFVRRHVAVSFVPLGRRSTKVLVVGLAIIATLENLGFNVTSLLAGIGIGGLAVALAAQKTVEHLFGSISLVADQPVRVGDVCRFGDKMGTVEDIGLRSTRIRTPDRTVISIPNAEFASMQIENFSKRDRTWLHTTLSLRYETTPDQLRFILIELRKLLLAHPKVHPDPARVRFIGFGSYSLDVEIFAYVLTSDGDEFLAIREDIFLRIMELIAASGTGFAFPSQTSYTATDRGIDDDKRRSAEAQVQQWRERGALCLPDFPAAEIAALDDTLDYPPKGAAVRG